MRKERISDDIMRLNFYNHDNDNAYIRRCYYNLNKNNYTIEYYFNNDIYYECNGRYYRQFNHQKFELIECNYRSIYNKIKDINQDKNNIR